jgi:peptidoglycan-associated lipoprotein
MFLEFQAVVLRRVGPNKLSKIQNNMKRATIFHLFVAGAILLFGATACKKHPTGITTIPNQPNLIGNKNQSDIVEPGLSAPVFDPSKGDSFGIAEATRPVDWDTRNQDRSKFAADTVYFAVDSAAVRGSEKSKLEDVANFFKSNPAGDLLIEGHCDERGTEGYNLSLGDKRANSLREYLVNLGVPAERIHTVSFGEAKPAVDGHNEAAWSKNRRGEFVFVEPAK